MYDKTGQDIIGPLLSVKELRDLGVTLHLLLHSPRSVLSNSLKNASMRIHLLSRDAIPDAPCVYFCLPSEDNIQRICQVNTWMVGKIIPREEFSFVDSSGPWKQLVRWLPLQLHITSFKTSVGGHRHRSTAGRMRAECSETL